jgi:hypothetical protein
MHNSYNIGEKSKFESSLRLFMREDFLGNYFQILNIKNRLTL